jgi:hypothetical protein
MIDCFAGAASKCSMLSVCVCALIDMYILFPHFTNLLYHFDQSETEFLETPFTTRFLGTFRRMLLVQLFGQLL